MFVTPPEASREESRGDSKSKRSPGVARSVAGLQEQAELASPELKKGKEDRMKRTPQPNLAQSKLSATGGTLTIQNGTTASGCSASTVPAKTPAAAPQLMELGEDGIPHPIRMTLVAGMGTEPLTADFFINLIGENTRKITERIDKMADDLCSLTRTVEDNSGAVASNSAKLQRQAAIIEEQRSMLSDLGNRVGMREGARGGGREIEGMSNAVTRSKSSGYVKARRSVRLWPVNQESVATMWEGVGQFIGNALGIPDTEVSMEDIESVTALPDSRLVTGNVCPEVLVTFHETRKRDTVTSSAARLATCIDGAGRPTEGIRLEIPDELMDTFRLLARFGTRLRAKHGEGTKGHIKFDDHEAGLYMNIKLPGDETWSRVTPLMAKADMDWDARVEATRVLRRIAAKGAVSGPRERLAIPTTTTPTRERATNTPVPRSTAPPTLQTLGSRHARPKETIGTTG